MRKPSTETQLRRLKADHARLKTDHSRTKKELFDARLEGQNLRLRLKVVEQSESEWRRRFDQLLFWQAQRGE